MTNLQYRWLIILSVILLPARPVFAASTVSSTFDVDADGWTATPGAATVAHEASGGNPGGFLSSTDTDPTTPVVIAPAKFLGDLSAYDGGVLSYDMKVLDPTTPVTSVGDGLGRVQINGGGSNATFIYLPSPPFPSPDAWRRFVVPLTAAAFNTTQANWEQVLSNATHLDVIIQHGTKVGMDNVTLTPAPDLSNLIVFLEPGFSFEIVNRDVSAGQVPILYATFQVAEKEGELYLNGLYSPSSGVTRDAIVRSGSDGPGKAFAYLNSPAGFNTSGPVGMHFDANGDLIGIVWLQEPVGKVISRPLVRITGFGPPPAPIAFQELNGQVVLEAEHYDGNVSASAHTWTLETAKAGFAGTGYVSALPNAGTSINTGYTSTSPQLLFNVNFTSPGTYYVWVRGQADSGSDDSCHAGLDGTGPTSADRIASFSSSGWVWKRDTMDGSPATLVIGTPGPHTIHLWMREDGLRVDKLLLRTNSSSTAPLGAGPAESPRQ